VRRPKKGEYEISGYINGDCLRPSRLLLFLKLFSFYSSSTQIRKYGKIKKVTLFENSLEKKITLWLPQTPSQLVLLARMALSFPVSVSASWALALPMVKHAPTKSVSNS